MPRNKEKNKLRHENHKAAIRNSNVVKSLCCISVNINGLSVSKIRDLELLLERLVKVGLRDSFFV